MVQTARMLGIACKFCATAALFNKVFNRNCGYLTVMLWDIALTVRGVEGIE
jgi:hypothetical protein